MNKIVVLFLLISVNIFGQELPQNFKKSTVKIEEEFFDVYKGQIKVLMNRSDSASGYLTLPVHVYKSSSNTPAEPIVYLTGGPGQSNFDYVPAKDFLVNHDFVVIGYRGVDGSVIMKSKRVARSLKGRHHHLWSDESLEHMGSRMKAYHQKLTEQGIDINNFTIIDVIDDFEEARQLLGYSKINLFSASYGTRVALLYSYRYPDAIHRSVMVGGNAPGYFVWRPENTARVIRKYDSLYAAQSAVKDISIEESIRLSFEQMPKRWSLFRLDCDKIRAATFPLMYDKKNAVMAFDAYRKAALENDYSGLYLMQLAYDYTLPKMIIWGDFFCKGYSADYYSTVNYLQYRQTDSASIGAPLSVFFSLTKEYWPMKMIDEEYRKTRISETETLMISGNLDNTAPAEIATSELMPYLPNGKQVILKDMAHCGDLLWRQHDAAKHLVIEYFDEGIVDDSRFKHDPVSFTPKKSFNKMAKVYYPFILIASMIK